MTEGGCAMIVRPPNDVSIYSDVTCNDEDLLLDHDPVFDATCSDQSRHAAALALDVTDAWDDSQPECFPLEMQRALRLAVSSGKVTPLLKEELRCKIQLKRLQRGKAEMTSDFSVRPSPMSVEEILKRNRKMEQNRKSAQKSRDRQKSLEQTITDRLERLQKDNDVLESHVRKLRHACNMARQWLNQHCACQHHQLFSAAEAHSASVIGSCRRNSESSISSSPVSSPVSSSVSSPVFSSSSSPLVSLLSLSPLSTSVSRARQHSDSSFGASRGVVTSYKRVRHSSVPESATTRLGPQPSSVVSP